MNAKEKDEMEQWEIPQKSHYLKSNQSFLIQGKEKNKGFFKKMISNKNKSGQPPTRMRYNVNINDLETIDSVD